MKKIVIITILSFVLVSCNSNQPTTKLDSLSRLKARHNLVLEKGKNTTNIKKGKDSLLSKAKQLIGIWKLKGSDNPTLSISKSKITYIDHLAKYEYKIIGDSIRMKQDDFDENYSYRLQYKFKNNNTLILTGDDGETIYFRVRE